MAFANSSISDIVALTMKNRSPTVADNVTKNNAILAFLKKKGNVRTIDGGSTIDELLSYAENGNGAWYSGYDTLSVGAQDVISAAEFALKLLAVPVTISGQEKLQNSGSEKVKDLLKQRMKVAESSMANLLAGGVYSDGTGFGGKQLTGLGAAVVALPTSGTYGGIDRSTTIGTFWRNQYTGSLGAPSATTIQAQMLALWVKLVRGQDKTDLIVGDNTFFTAYLSSLQSLQRFTDESTANLGFENVKYMSSPVVLDGGIGGFCPAGTAFFLNTDYLFLRPHKDRNMVPIGEQGRQSTNQDAEVNILGWAGNMTCSNASLQGYFQGS